MSSATSPPSIEEMLLTGPRGRRLLLEYVLASELAHNPIRTEETFGYAAIHASLRLAPDPRNTNVAFGWSTSDIRQTEITPAEVAERLNALELSKPTPQLLRKALTAAAGSARYWQVPDGEDLLAATPEMRQGLRRVAAHIAASHSTAWWCTPVAFLAQQSVRWGDNLPKTIPHDPRATLLKAREGERTIEHTAREELFVDAAADWSGGWWSRPPQDIPASARVLFDGSPAGLWFVEDGLGWERAESERILVPENASVFEIASAADWAELCVRFPLEVTAQKRHDWYRTTARTARWVMPDWAQVAEQYDAVHLQVGAYLAAAGVAILVDEDTDSASVIAGWNPDETYWFSSNISYSHESIKWRLEDDGTDMVWKSASTRNHSKSE